MIKPADKLAQKLGLEFDRAELLRSALTHRSVGSDNNERLEFLGDAILGFVIASRIFDAKDQAAEGDMSRIRAALVRKETLADIAQQWDIGSYLMLGSGELKSGGFRRASILADSVEALIGAVYRDKGLRAAEQLIVTLYGDRLTQLAVTTASKDPKSQLQERLQSTGAALPSYHIVNETGPAHKRFFEVECILAALEISALGQGTSRRKAEQAAAEAVLELLVEEST
ncbi:MAG: ribonuclease III [Gammaproteobacteria bacterium]